MKEKIECIVSGESKEEVNEVINNLSFSISSIEEIDMDVSNIERRSGFYEEIHIASILITTGGSIITGLAANAIWTWIQSKKEEKIKDLSSNKLPVKIEIGTVNIIISIDRNNK